MKRLVVLILVAVLVLGSVGAAIWLIGGSDPEPEADPIRTPKRTEVAADPETRTPLDPALAEFYAQEPTWEACRGDFECARIEVPMDYSEPTGDRIELQLLKRPADVPEQRIGSLVVNPGGPGAPGTSYAEQAGFAFSRDLRGNFDIVGFDPRGTGESTPVDCVTDEELDEARAGDPSPQTPAEIKEYDAGNRAFLAGCAEKSGKLAAHVSTVEAARDMDVIRAVLGEPGLDYFGASYGTKLGATYADLFPEHAGHMVLDGAVDPTTTAREDALEQAAGFETALTAYVENCLESSGCFLGDSVDAGLDRIKQFLESVEENPIPAGGERELRIGNAFYGLVAPLYNRDYWPLLSTALRTGFNGNATMLMMLSDLYAARGPDGTYQDNSAEAILAINCLDDPSTIPIEQVPEEMPAFLEASPTFGEIFAWGLIGCAGIQVESDEVTPEYRAIGADPILVIGTTRDPATPVQWAEAMAERLESGILIRRDGDGHTGYNQGNQCVDDAVEDFLLDGTVPEADLDC